MVESRKSLRIWSAIPLVIFLATYATFAELTELRCKRPEGVCVLSHKTLLSENEISIRLEDLQGAHKEGSGGLSRTGTGHTFLDTRQGPIPFEIWGSNNSANISTSVQQFLKSPKQKEFNETFDSRLNVFGAGAFLLVGSIILLWLSFRAPPTSVNKMR